MMSFCAARRNATPRTTTAGTKSSVATTSSCWRSDWLEFGDRLRKARPSVVQMSLEDVECLLERVEECAKRLFGLAEAGEREEWFKAAEASGELRRA
jgi:hypothetical protein